MSLNPEIAKAAEWVQSQISQSCNAFCDCGFTVSTHENDVRRVEFTLTTKIKPTQAGGTKHDTRY